MRAVLVLCLLALGGVARAASPARLVQATQRAARFLVRGNMPEHFALDAGQVVDPGSTAHVGRDAHGRGIWVVDQKVRFAHAPADLAGRFLDGFFTGAAHGKRGNGLTARLISVRRGGRWSAAAPSDNGAIGLARSPFADPSIESFVVHVDDVRPVPGPRALLRPASMDLLVETHSAIRGRDHAEFTVHFLNPDARNGPVPGTTDGAVRYRATRHADGSATLEGYYLTAAATEYADALTDHFKPVSAVKSAMKLGVAAWGWTPMGFLSRPLTNATVRTLESAADGAIGATGAVRQAVATLHARYYREVLFPNLVGE